MFHYLRTVQNGWSSTPCRWDTSPSARKLSIHGRNGNTRENHANVTQKTSASDPFSSVAALMAENTSRYMLSVCKCVLIYVKPKKMGFTTSKFTWRKKTKVYNVKIYVAKKKSGFTTSKLTWRKKTSGFTTSKFTWRKKNRGLQRQNLREKWKFQVYNVTDNVNQNRVRQNPQKRPNIEETNWTNIYMSKRARRQKKNI